MKTISRAKTLAILLLSIVHTPKLPAQNTLNIPISGNFEDLTIVEFLEILETRHGVKVYYVPSKVPFYRQSFHFDSVPLYRALESFLDGIKLDVIKYRDVIYLADKLTVTSSDLEDILAKWSDGSYQKPISDQPRTESLYFGDSLKMPRGKVELRGSIIDKYTGEPIVGAVLQNYISGLGTTSDEEGRFVLQEDPGFHQYVVSYLGYQDIVVSLHWYESGEHTFEMQVHALNLTEVVVEASSLQNKIEEAQIGVEAISMKEIREIPAFLGEVDILKSIEQLPGVSAVGEASAGFNVRGGNIDQNLVMLDDALLFNASHALGFFSIFNADAVRNVSLYKGNIPAQYGGRLSSVLQVELKDGNPNKWQGRGGVGLASARLVLDGPASDKTRLVIGLRSSYSNWLLRRIRKTNIRDSRIYFGDAIFKVTHRLNDQHTITASTYLSYDEFEFAREFGYNWSTALANLRWSFFINNRLNLTTSLITGDYDSNQFIPEGDDAFNLRNGIDYWKLRSNLSFQNERHFINLGTEVLKLNMDAERIEPFHSESSIKEETIDKDQGIEVGIYANDESDLGNRFSLSGGIRFSYYAALGPSKVRIYDPQHTKSPGTIISEQSYRSGEKIIDYSAIEPRLSLNWKWTEDQSIKLSYNHLQQYVHLISNTASPTPVDIWQLANVHLQPQAADNFSLGYFKQKENLWEFAIEAFYKKIDDLPQFKDLATLLVNETIETEILAAEGRSYGIELSYERKVGRWRGAFAYTYGRSEARTNGLFAEEIINDNRWYFSYFDQPHQLNMQFKYSIDPVQHLQLGFSYKTGRPITVPIANYQVQDVLVTHYSDRNLFRVPAYHRFDIGYTIDKSQAKLKGFRNSFTVSFFNLYGRKNAFSIYFRRDSNNIQRAYKLSVLGSVFPSITWNFTF